MPRPRTIDDEVVLRATAQLMGKVGPAKLTLARVADEVGLSPATLLQRFGSKRGLMLAVSEFGAGAWPDTFTSARERHDSPLAALEAALTGLTASVSTPEAMANSLAYLQIDLSDPDFHRLADDGMRQMRQRVRGLLDEAVEAGELGATDTERLATAVITTYNGALITWAIHRKGGIAAWLREQLAVLLGPYRAG